MTRVLGVDGARGGWVGALVVGDRVTWRRLPDIGAALATDVEVIGVDMPIGLPARGRRECDLLAKQALGAAHPRVFLTPPRAVLDCAAYEEAGAMHRELVDGHGMSKQSWNLVPKIREVDAVAEDPRLVEVHPELSFVQLTGRALPPKKTPAGRRERLEALRGWLPCLGDGAAVPAGDDGLDALVAAWSAARWAAGTAIVLPADPPLDALGRPMRIVS